ncbi:PEP/pyruvate-binding domain-containing protein [Endozoicomonas sp. ALC020]|uniref:PEP/pyruvate-binding domain-containing protein n=1 Tax=unclassified Endozoicomonas TaxID=2644528 RepID=UPI003BAEFBCE
MLNANFGDSKLQIPTTNSNQDTWSGSPTNRSESESKRHFDPGGVPAIEMPLAKRLCRLSVPDQVGTLREQLGGKGMFLQGMKDAGLDVPPFKCVTTQVVNALEQHPLNPRSLVRYLPDIAYEPGAQASLAHIREYLDTLPASDVKRTGVLKGLAEFIASDDFYQQIKESEAAQQIRDLRHQLDKPSLSTPVIVRSSGINEDNYGDAQAGKYLSLVQEEDDVLRTCLKVMASGYHPEVCPAGVPQPMALIIQECIDCQYGGVIMSFKSFRDGTIGVEFTRGQPRGVVAGQSGNTPHRIDISDEEGPDSYQYFPGTISSHFVLRKSTNGYSETRIENADTHKDDVSHIVNDKMVSDIRKMVTTLESLLLCPVDAEFAINPEGDLFLLQVRPVTQLSGDMDFAMTIPKETIAIGAGVSEGFCTGSLWLARRPEADSMPDGAIVLADHVEDWMLEPRFLKRVGGFVIAKGGFNDHVAILMKQEQKTLMLAGDQFEALSVQAGQQATLVCACFNDEPGAFIVAGDLSGKLASCRKLSSAVTDVSLAKAIPSRDDLSFPEGTFLEVASGFKWLTDQNARLLALFAPGAGLDGLANPVKLSMSPQRSRILAETEDSVNRLVYGAEALLQGYQAFLQLAGEKGSPEVQLLRDELPQLTSRFETLQKTIKSRLERIILLMQAAEKGRPSPANFRQWLADCHKLQSDLQALNPGQAEQVRSVHELIFALHQRFVNALAPVTLASGQGRISKEKKITYVDCTTSGGSVEKAPLLRPSDKVFIEEAGKSGTVVSTDDALIVNLKLGVHMSVIELLEQADGGKGRTLRLKLSDEFNNPDEGFKSGKLKRMWFLAQFLKAIELDENSDPMKISCNAAAGEITIECPQMKSRKTMQNAFEQLLIVINGMFGLDTRLEEIAIFGRDQWDFNVLAQHLNCDVTTEADRFAFQHSLFSIFYIQSLHSIPPCYKLLSNHQQFIHHAHRLGVCHFLISFKKESKGSFREMFMSDEMSEDIRREILQHLVLLDPKRGTRLYEDVYPDLKDKYFVITPTHDYRPDFVVQPVEPYGEHNEQFAQTLLKHGLKYASKRARSDYSYLGIRDHSLKKRIMTKPLSGIH